MRCFVAIELPRTVREQLAAVQDRLRGLDRLVRWTRPEQIHLTIKFLGEVPESQIAKVCRAVVDVAAGLEPIPLEVGSAGCFPPSGPARVLWAGVAGPPPGLVECHRQLEEACAALGFPPEDRAFRPHLTLGRSREGRGSYDIRRGIEAEQAFAGGHFTAKELIVFESVLGRSGPTYTPLVHARFGG